MADGERKHLFSTRHSISSQKPTAKIANVPRMGREGGRKVCGKLFVSAAERNCIGNNLSSCSPLSPPPRISLCPREFQISFAEAETDRGGGCGSRKFSMAKSSIIAVSSSISSSLWCQCGDEPKECSTLCGAPISSIKSTSGWHSNSSEEGGTMAGNTCE